jgi:DNA recombination protein RmuC
VVTAVSLTTALGFAVLLLISRRTSRPADAALSTAVSQRIEAVDRTLSNTETKLTTQVEGLDAKVALLAQSVERRQGALTQQVTQIGDSMEKIAGVFSNDRARGGWGELSLRRLFELAGLVEHRDFSLQQASPAGIPDAVVHLPGSRRIVIDAKFSVARYNEAVGAADPDEELRLLRLQAKDMERDAKSLVSKGYHETASGGYVVMYLPSQAVWEATAAADPELLGRLMKLRIIVAGPNTLHALLLTAGTLLAEHRFIDEAHQVIVDARELGKRLGSFHGHLAKVGKGLASAVAAFNQAAGSWDRRLTPQVNKMADAGYVDAVGSLERVDDPTVELSPNLEMVG